MKDDKKSRDLMVELKEIGDGVKLSESVPNWLARRINDIPDELRDLDPNEVVNLFKRKGFKITETLDALRDSFWMEYERALQQRRKMIACNIYFDICGEVFFHRTINVPEKLAYIITPIVKYEARLHTLLRTTAIDTLRDIMSVPLTDEDGFNTEIARLKLAAIKQLEDRVKGMPVQKTETKSVNVTLTNPDDLKDIDKRIAEIEKELTGKLVQDVIEGEVVGGE